MTPFTYRIMLMLRTFQVQDKFLLNLSEEDAIKAFEALLKENNYFASVLDRIHFVAQYWRS